MATYYYSSWVGPSDFDLDNVANYYNDALLTDPAGLKPGIGDIVVQMDSIGAGTTDANVQMESNTHTINGGTFNGTYTTPSGGTLTVQGGTFNGNIAITGGTTFQLQSGTFNADLSITFPSILRISSNSLVFGSDFRLNLNGDWLQEAVIPNYPDAEDVRDGVAFGDELTGFLDLPAESDVRSGVTYDDNTKEGTLGGGTITITVE